ncbi:MAG: hypothetical protein OEM52_14135 [bacterium]|nr:hypothetical protein [bacterium]
MRKVILVSFVSLLWLLTSCATFRSDLSGAYTGEVKRNPNTAPVSVFFVFTHVEQTIGYDAVPKLVSKNSSTHSFDEIFADALREFSNTGKYATFTEEASDVNQPERRAKKDSLKGQFDYTVKVRIVSEKYFSGFFLGTLFSSISATLLPIPFKQYYRMETEIITKDGKLVGKYKRNATLSKWVETFLIFVYPFHPENRKREEIYVAMLHDTFRQIESEGVLSAK